MSAVSIADVAVGTALPPQSFHIDRLGLVRYAGASGDFNVIHWNERVATAVGLPNVIAHGMLTMALAARVVTDWVQDPGAVVEYGTRFTRPVPVPDDDAGATIDVTGSVTAVNEDGTVQVGLVVKYDGQTVLGNPKLTVRLA